MDEFKNKTGRDDRFQNPIYLIDKSKQVVKRRLFIWHRLTETHTIRCATNARDYLAKKWTESKPFKTNAYFKRSE